MGHGQGMELMDSNIFCRNVYTGKRQRQGPGLVVSYCVISIPWIASSSYPVQCEEATNRLTVNSMFFWIPPETKRT